MRRGLLSAICVGLCLAVGGHAFEPPGPMPQTVVVPKGPAPHIAPPKVVPPKVDPAEPVVDPLQEFRIEAYVDGELIGDDTVPMQPGQLLVLRIKGQPVEEGEELPAIRWAMNAESKSLEIHPADGHHLCFTARKAGGWLFVASANSPDPLGAPLLLTRWVVVGTPPPDEPPPDGPVPPGPGPDPKPVPGGPDVGKWLDGVPLYPERKADIAALAANFHKAAAESDVAAAKNLVADLNGKSLGERWEHWLPFFEALDADATARKVNDAGTRAYFEAIAKGLEAPRI